MRLKMSATFSFELTVASEDIDTLNHVNNVVYLKWINEASTKHWDQLSNNKINQAYSWVALRHEIDYLRPAFLNDLITVKTWIGETSGVKSIRYVEIYSNEQLLTKAKTTWVLLDAKTMRPKRIQDDILSVLKPSK
ncbi:MAG: acyl-CoA thioesterase [Flavobacteriales bacterium]|jgi:acyl-CoA thioester hydrolase|nr:acyl-CoA thioesterase [Flavobacteriales bacterium]